MTIKPNDDYYRKKEFERKLLYDWASYEYRRRRDIRMILAIIISIILIIILWDIIKYILLTIIILTIIWIIFKNILRWGLK